MVCVTVLGGTARAHRTPAQGRAGLPGTNMEKGSQVWLLAMTTVSALQYWGLLTAPT